MPPKHLLSLALCNPYLGVDNDYSPITFQNAQLFMYWDQLTTIDIDQLNREIPVVLPISATEQHGPHLPLATDRLIGEHFCAKIDERVPKEILWLPSLSVGCSEHHTVFSGSLSVTHRTYLQQMEEILGWVVHYGFRNIVLFNSHGGNIAIGQSCVQSFGFRHPNCRIFMVTWWQLINEELEKVSEGAIHTGHAGELETSLMLIIAPHLVKTAFMPTFANRENYEWAKANLLHGSRISYFRHFKELSANGVIGSPQYASVEKGKIITKLVVDYFLQFLEDIKTTFDS